MMITFQGKIGMYGTSPIYQPSEVLDINGNIFLHSDDNMLLFGTNKDAAISFDSNSLNIIANSTVASDALEMTAGRFQFITGNVGIGIVAPTEKLHIDGNALITTNLTVNNNIAATTISTLSSVYTNLTSGTKITFVFDGTGMVSTITSYP